MDFSDFRKKAVFHDGPSADMKRLGSVCEEMFGGELIDADTFYREIFPPDTIEHYHKGSPEPDGHKGNPLVLCQRGAWMWSDNKPNWAHGIDISDPMGEYHTRHIKRILFNDYKWLHDWRNLPDCQHVWVGGLTYIGKKRNLAHAVSMHAMIFDIDFITEVELKRFFMVIQNSDDIYPIPNYISITGNGIHLYYTFVEPIPLYHGTYGRRIKKQLNTLKIELTKKLWNPYTVGEEHGRKPQFQGINQAFRMVGSYTKSLDIDHNRYKVIAYKFPQVKPYDSLEYLYRFVDIPEEERYKERSVFDLEYWKNKNPEWYERRIVNNDKSIKYWDIDRRLYDWWLRQVREKAEYGHRYNCLFCAVVYGVKCGIDEEEIEADLLDLLPKLSALKPDDPITPSDVYEAMDAYTKDLNTYPRKSIEYLSGITFDIPRRNGRKQIDHLKGARALQDIYNPNWRAGNGRKPKKQQVKEWRSEHPDGTKAQCIKDTGLSKPTVYKWW